MAVLAAAAAAAAPVPAAMGRRDMAWLAGPGLAGWAAGGLLAGGLACHVPEQQVVLYCIVCMGCMYGWIAGCMAGWMYTYIDSCRDSRLHYGAGAGATAPTAGGWAGQGRAGQGRAGQGHAGEQEKRWAAP